MTKGVLLIGCGHPNYGRMALNLAVAIKVVDPEIKIALAFSGNSLDLIGQYNLNHFIDEFVPVPMEAFTRNGKVEWIKTKTWMYDLSPFEETIFLDVDMMWHPQMKISALFDTFGKSDLTFQNRGFIDLKEKVLPADYSMWADVNEIKKYYGFKTGKYYQLHSEFVFFRKCEKVKAFFESAKFNYDNLLVKSFVFGGGIPDELPFGIAMIQHKMYPHLTPYTPIYWEVTEKRGMHRRPGDLYKEFFAYSTGGSFHDRTMKIFYDNLAKYYFNKVGLQNPYFLQNKRDYMPERKNL